MNIPRRRALALPASALALATVALGANAFAAVRAPVTAAHGPVVTSAGWRLSKTVSIRGRSVIMVGVDATRADDAWAAGTTFSQEYGTVLSPVLEHWDGRSWRPVALPARAARYFGGTNIFASVGALSAHDVWAISFTGRYLWLHGHSWTFGALPGTKGGKVVIDTVKALSPSDVWAFGSRSVGSVSQINFAPYAARFDGRTWTTVPVPGRGILGAVSVISAHDIWAVLGEPVATRATRVMRWTGATWRPVPIQPSLTKSTYIATILATNNSDVWIGGNVSNSKHGTSELAQHWNGKTWTRASPPTVATSQGYTLGDFVADGRGGFWAIGTNINGAQRFWHNSGGTWSTPTRSAWQLYQLVAVPDSTSIWGVGWNASQTKGLIALHGPVPH